MLWSSNPLLIIYINDRKYCGSFSFAPLFTTSSLGSALFGQNTQVRNSKTSVCELICKKHCTITFIDFYWKCSISFHYESRQQTIVVLAESLSLIDITDNFRSHYNCGRCLKAFTFTYYLKLW